MKRQRSTKQRKLVSRTVQSHRAHPTAEDIYAIVRKDVPNISRGTVYRNLNLLVKNEEIRHLSTSSVDRFDWRLEPHYHLVCTRCGTVTDAPLPYRTEFDADVARKTGYEITQHATVFEGICPECRGREGAAGAPE